MQVVICSFWKSQDRKKIISTKVQAIGMGGGEKDTKQRGEPHKQKDHSSADN